MLWATIPQVGGATARGSLAEEWLLIFCCAEDSLATLTRETELARQGIIAPWRLKVARSTVRSSKISSTVTVSMEPSG